MIEIILKCRKTRLKKSSKIVVLSFHLKNLRQYSVEKPDTMQVKNLEKGDTLLKREIHNNVLNSVSSQCARGKSYLA